MQFEFDANNAKFSLNIKQYNVNFSFDGVFTSEVASNAIVYHNNDYELFIKYNDNYLDLSIYPKINIDNLDFNISSDNSIILLNRDNLEFRGIDNNLIFSLNYINIYDSNNDFKYSDDLKYEKNKNNYIIKLSNLKQNNIIQIGMSLADVNVSNSPSSQSITSLSPSDRSIYQPSDGDTAFAIYLFQGFYENPETNELVIDYPLNTWNGVAVAGTIPVSSTLIGNNSDFEYSFNNNYGLDSFTIYIEFVCNKIIAIDGFAPPLYYDIIPPTTSAYYLYDQKAEFIGNINGVSVYRGQYVVHKQSMPLYIDGMHKIVFRVEKQSYGELIFKTQIISPFAVVGLTQVNDATKIIA